MTVSHSPTSSLANRYGDPKRALSRRGKIILWTAVAVISLAFVAWLGLGRGPAAVTNSVVGFSVTDATQTELDFQVTKDAGATAQCAAKAMDEAFAVVGWDVITIGPNSSDVGSNSGKTTAQRAMIHTDTLAVSAVVDSCWIVPTQ